MQSRRRARPSKTSAPHGIAAQRMPSAPCSRRTLGALSSLTAAVLSALYGGPSVATTTATASTAAATTSSEDSALEEVHPFRVSKRMWTHLSVEA